MKSKVQCADPNLRSEHVEDVVHLALQQQALLREEVAPSHYLLWMLSTALVDLLLELDGPSPVLGEYLVLAAR